MKKKIILILVLLLTYLYLNVEALSSWKVNSKNLNTMSDNIKEEVITTYDQNGILSQLDITLEIPEDYEKKNITINPSIFDSIKEYKKLLPGDRIKINLKIKNNSKYNYNYISNSFLISTSDPTLLGIKDNFIDTTAIGFDNRTIYDISTPYRSANEALLSLYNYAEEDDIKEGQLQDDSIDKKLKGLGYTGISELDKYYLDFYNNKYNLKEEELEYFTDSTIKEIFSGKTYQIKETNKSIIELAYNFFYNKLLSYNFKEEIVTDYNSENYSIGSYMRKIDDNQYIKDAFEIIRSNTYNQINNMYLTLNKTYTTKAFDNYNYYVQLEFKLIKEENTQVFNEDLIVPPNTGI